MELGSRTVGEGKSDVGGCWWPGPSSTSVATTSCQQIHAKWGLLLPAPLSTGCSSTAGSQPRSMIHVEFVYCLLHHSSFLQCRHPMAELQTTEQQWAKASQLSCVALSLSREAHGTSQNTDLKFMRQSNKTVKKMTILKQ